MSTLTIALPCAIPPRDYLNALEQEAHWPILKKIAQGAHFSASSSTATESESLPKEASLERWLAQKLDLDNLPLAPLLLIGDGLDAQQKGWVVLQPVHLHAARDHLVLSSPNQLALSDVHAQALFKAAHEPLNELSSRLILANPMHWYAGDENLGQLQTYSPLCAIGRNIDIWMPQGEHARFWRKLQNEIQMIWHDHPVNQERTENNLLPINSLWLFGQGQISTLTVPYKTIYTDDPLLKGIAQTAQACLMDLPLPTALLDLKSNDDSPSLLWLDQLSDAYLNQNWTQWLEIFAQLEKNYLEPYYLALKKGQLHRLKLILFGEQGWLTVERHAKDNWKWWRRQSLMPHLFDLATL